MNTLKGFFRLLMRCYRLAAPYGRKRLSGVIGIIFVSGLFQVIGVSSIFPFFALASDPGRVERSNIGRHLLGLLPEMGHQQVLITAGVFSILMLFLANAVTLLGEVVRERYAHGFGLWLRMSMMERLVRRPYGYFLERNSGTLLQKVTGDVSTFVGAVVVPLLEVLTRSVTFLLLVVTVLLVQPVVAISMSVGLGAYYLVVFLLVRPRATEVGEALRRHNGGQLIAGQQLIAGIKPILVHGAAPFFLSRFREHAAAIARIHPRMPLYTNSPRYLIEPLAFGGMVAIVVTYAWHGRPFADILPNLAVIALAGYRILPTVHMLYSQVAAVMAKRYTLDELETELREERRAATAASGAQARDVAKSKLRGWKRCIRFDNVSFAYGRGDGPALRDLTLMIHKNENIGIAGTTGSGKSTLVDLILGLHRPQQGRILVDEVELTEGLVSGWRTGIGYVPQEIYLTDATIAANIAFGVPEEEIDEEQLRKAAEAAQIIAFIEAELPDGFQTLVGERGVRLSGGQRQRIGLARALYHQPEMLVLDEATSALDLATEKAVMETIHSLQGHLTIVTIAHRLSTLERCDRILTLSGGRVTEAARDTASFTARTPPVEPERSAHL